MAFIWLLHIFEKNQIPTSYFKVPFNKELLKASAALVALSRKNAQVC